MKKLPLRLRVIRSMPLTLLLYLEEWKLLGEFLDECVEEDDTSLYDMIEREQHSLGIQLKEPK